MTQWLDLVLHNKKTILQVHGEDSTSISNTGSHGGIQSENKILISIHSFVDARSKFER